VVQAGDRDTAIADLRKLTEAGAYRLGPPERIDLRDRYVDTRAGELRAAGFALRLRRRGNEATLALKGPARILPGGVVDRYESEAPWSVSFLGELLATLRGLGVPLELTSAALPQGTPEEVLDRLGLVGIHERAMVRERRFAARADGDENDPVAEVVLDSVSFPLKSHTVVHHEIEVEGLGPDAAAHAADVAAAIASRLGEAVRPWPFGKLTAGKVLEALEAEERLDPLLDERGRIGPDGYDVLEARIRPLNTPSVET
jgi:hypothetical protein